MGNLNPEKVETLSPELQVALEPLLNVIESLSERIQEYNERIEALATARKLAVLLHHLWVSGEVYEPWHNGGPMTVGAAA